MVDMMKPFKLHDYPYIYQCEHCKNRYEKPFKMPHEQERQLKDAFKVKSDLPLFFECDFCHDDLMKPIGYKGKPGFILNSDVGW